MRLRPPVDPADRSGGALRATARESSGVHRHYEQLLGPIFTWSVSAGGDPYERASAWLRAHALLDGATYLDLGAGFGAHTLPLAQAGKQVTAVDFAGSLICELRDNTRAHLDRVEVVEGDFVDYVHDVRNRVWDVSLCAGDTLTHLQSPAMVQQMLADLSARLSTDGRLALEYRDLTGPPPEGLERFILVARDDRRTMHCLIDEIDEQHLRVTDIVTEITTEGPITRLSDYTKLRISPESVVAWAAASDLELQDQTTERRMVSQVFRTVR